MTQGPGEPGGGRGVEMGLDLASQRDNLPDITAKPATGVALPPSRGWHSGQWAETAFRNRVVQNT